MFEVVFLGTGAGIPTAWRAHSSIWMRREGTCLLLDCGEGTQRQLMKAHLNFMKIDRIFITHWHADHWAGLIGLLLSMNLEGRSRPLYIHAPEAERFVSDILDLGYWGTGFEVIPKPVPHQGDEITRLYNTPDIEVTSIPVRHSVPAVAYCVREHDKWNVDISKAEKLYGLKEGPMIGRLKERRKIVYKGRTITLEEVGTLKKGARIVYSGDTMPCKSLARLAEHADVLIHDTTFLEGPEEDEKPHSGAGDAAAAAREAGVSTLVMTHFSRRYRTVGEIEEEAKKLFANSIAAEDFMKLTVKGGEPVEVENLKKKRRE